ncbi:hypothetical protein B0T17DRAFT_359540 [Bombardia bombarda]|uniref:DUF1279 domain-containing protein n=1 Tax=Bombardia bombarda TaxID=252184 RepID=A0AA39WI80_9PEZI|nr:hypothetical protein B0T17DRAFT_359540 [Bombardia bombarda]
MLRTTLGAADALLGGGIMSRRIAKDAAGKQVWFRQLSTKNPSLQQRSWIMSQFWAQRLANVRSATKTARIRTPLSKRSFHSSKARRSDASANPKAAEPEPATLSAKLKKLSREYGWAAVGVYFSLSVLDFPFCFMLVRIVGTEKIAAIEHVVVTWVQKAIPDRVKEFWHDYREALKENRLEQQGGAAVLEERAEMAGWGVKEAEEKRKSDGASLTTQLALAYAIHKSFIFVRVPLTAAILPKVVKVLRSWGWNIGKKRSKR